MTIEQRARDILGLGNLEPEPRYLSARIENLWRAEGFADVVPFNGSIFVPLGPQVDMGLLRESLMTVLKRHEVLHSRLALKDGRSILVATDVKEPDLRVTDVSKRVIAAHREGGEPSALSEFVETPVHLLAEPGFRSRLFRDEDGNLALGLMLHHYFGDGWSSQVLRREITTTLVALGEGKTPVFAQAAQYADFALAQRQVLSASLDKQLGYWRGRLEKAQPCRLPYDHVRDTNQRGRLYVSIGEGVSSRLATLAQEKRVSVFVIYLAALHLLLARWCGEKHAITAVNTADRVKPQFFNTVGYLIASVPIYTEMNDGWRVGDLLSSVAKNFYDAYAHRDLAYDLYDRICEPPQPFCTTLFNFIPLQEKLSAAKSQSAALPPAGIFTGPPIQRVRVHREIYFCLVEMPRGMVGKVYYNLDFFTQETFEILVTEFGRILGRIAAEPDGPVRDILDMGWA
jgi:hypothetical protein